MLYFVATTANICKLPKVTGPCRARIPRWYFNDKTKRCERFIYGGCRGNKNNFKSLAGCQGKCPGRFFFCENIYGAPRKVFFLISFYFGLPVAKANNELSYIIASYCEILARQAEILQKTIKNIQQYF